MAYKSTVFTKYAPRISVKKTCVSNFRIYIE